MRKWSGKTLADHKHDRRAWVLATLGVDPSSATEGTNDKTREHFTWEPADRDDPIAPHPTRLLRAIAERHSWRAAYERARDGLPPPTGDSSAASTRHGDQGEEAA